MSNEALILTVLVAAIASIGLLRPAMLFQYPVVSAMITLVYIIPQVWRIETSGDLDDYEVITTWMYMTLCIVLTFAGFRAGAARSSGPARNELERFRKDYDGEKLLLAAAVLLVVGCSAWWLIHQKLSTMQNGDLWTGTIAFYALLTTFLTFGMVLSWILFLYTRSTPSLVMALIGFGVTLPIILLMARREVTFALGVTIFLGVFFVRKKSLSRLLLVPLLAIGTIFINQAGEIRAYISNNDSSLVGALSEKTILTTHQERGAIGETAGAISDITNAIYLNHYSFAAPFYNRLVFAYVPAFIVGRETKDGAMMAEDDDSDSGRGKLIFVGATRTGFADSFQSLHYFGSLIFFAIAYFMGTLWSKAKRGDIKAQIYYILFLPAGLKVFTESTAVFVTLVPLIFAVMGLVFWLAKHRGVAMPALRGTQRPHHRLN